MTKRLTLFAAAALLAGAALAGCGGSNRAETPPPAGRGVYTLNGGGGFNVDGTVSFINTALGNQVTTHAFDAGKVPNFMAIRGDQGYIVNSVSNTVQVVDLTTGGTVGVIGAGDFANPMKLALGPDGRAYVTNLMANNVAVLDLTRRSLLYTIDVSGAGAGPTGIAIANNKLYVTLTNMTIAGQSVEYGPGKVAVIPLGSTQVARTIEVPINPQDVLVDAAGRVHVSCTGNYADIPGSIAIIDPAVDAVQLIVPLGGAPGNLTLARNGRVFVADGARGVMAYESSTGAVVFGPDEAITRPGAAILDVRYDPQTQLLYAADFPNDRVLVIDPGNGQVLSTLNVGDGPAAIGVYPE